MNAVCSIYTSIAGSKCPQHCLYSNRVTAWMPTLYPLLYVQQAINVHIVGKNKTAMFVYNILLPINWFDPPPPPPHHICLVTKNCFLLFNIFCSDPLLNTAALAFEKEWIFFCIIITCIVKDEIHFKIILGDFSADKLKHSKLNNIHFQERKNEPLSKAKNEPLSKAKKLQFSKWI